MALAGCAGGGAEAAESLQTSAPPPTVEQGSGLGSISGLVLDDESVPVPGAEVAALEDGLTILTDPEGRFTFNEVPPGSKSIAVQKLGYEATALLVVVEPDGITEVQITLVKLRVTEAHYAVELGNGYVTCATGFPVLTVYPEALGVCSLILQSDEEARTVTFIVEPGVQESLSEIVWEPTQNVFGSALRSVNFFDGDGVGDVSGNSPLFFHEDGYDDDEEDEAEFDHFFWAAFGNINTSNPAHSVNIIFEQPVTIYFTKFFDMEMPEGYTAIP